MAQNASGRPGRSADDRVYTESMTAKERASASAAWRDHGLVFCTSVGTPLAAGNIRRSFRAITKAAGIGETWTPRELRHSFVSIMSDNGVSIETIADLAGHKNSTVTARVYRHQLKPVITQGAETMDDTMLILDAIAQPARTTPGALVPRCWSPRDGRRKYWHIA
jgi:Phage integrase family